jgi:hypothetical protein
MKNRDPIPSEHYETVNDIPLKYLILRHLEGILTLEDKETGRRFDATLDQVIVAINPLNYYY